MVYNVEAELDVAKILKRISGVPSEMSDMPEVQVQISFRASL